ncbi:cytosine permease [Acetobacteraceae bacterium KSS8]|uniref:Cytosine permease n=1 Tax=Endosaccharibacter trunci TaxID=2812733 RepID=A0ABT1WAS6_9PROT|nr:cytosine permease [Acetobacteraceae bacterium KSS8]
MHVERHGIDPVPLAERTIPARDLFGIFVNFLLNPATILKGGMAVCAGLSLVEACVAETLGALLAIVFYIVMASVGTDYGIPGQVAARMAFGVQGAKWASSLPRLIVSIYFFAFQTIVGAMAIESVLRQITRHIPSLTVIAALFGVLQALVAIFGYQSLRWLSRAALPVKIVVLGYLLYMLAFNGPSPAFRPEAVLHFHAQGGWHWALFAVWVNISSAIWLSMTTDASDFCRYSRDRRAMWVSIVLACLLGASIATLFGAWGACATQGASNNTFQVAAAAHPELPTLLLIVVVTILDNWTINVLNLYTGGLSLNNIATRWGRLDCTLLTSALGVALTFWPNLLRAYLGEVGLIGSIFAPIAGVMTFDLVVLRRFAIHVPSLYESRGIYQYRFGINIIAIASMLVGIIFYSHIRQDQALRTIGTAVLSGLFYVTAMKLWHMLSPRNPLITVPSTERNSR